jgi:hypothetical protein
MEEQRGHGGNYGRRESSEARAPTPCPIRRPLNPGVKHQHGGEDEGKGRYPGGRHICFWQ